MGAWEEFVIELRESNGGHWGEHPDCPIEDWRYEVACDYTRLSYWEWAAAALDRIAAEEDKA